jgi:hypothetical protein
MKLNELKLPLNSPEMDDLKGDDAVHDDIATAAGPYGVGWSSQSHEWYGDENGPESHDGRYKQKGDGGELVVINVPEYAMAKVIADELDTSYESNEFYDKSVYAQIGKDWYVNDYHGSWIKPMKQLEADGELEYLPRNVRDFSK